MNREKLAAISAMLRKLPEEVDTAENFNMRVWTAHVQPAPHECGFAGCAIGWAIHKKIIPELIWWNDEPYLPSDRLDGRVHDHFGCSAVAEVLDISELDARWLFFETYYSSSLSEEGISSDVVADRIDSFLAKGGVK